MPDQNAHDVQALRDRLIARAGAEPVGLGEHLGRLANSMAGGRGGYAGRQRLFKREVLRATDRLFKSAPWRGDVVRKYQRWCDRCAEAYGIPSVSVRVAESPAAALGHGYYRPERGRDGGVTGGEIVLAGPSVTTLLHEFRHHMQSCGVARGGRARAGDEPDARAWSVSLFARVRPEAYAAARDAGRLLFW